MLSSNLEFNDYPFSHSKFHFPISPKGDCSSCEKISQVWQATISRLIDRQLTETLIFTSWPFATDRTRKGLSETECLECLPELTKQFDGKWWMLKKLGDLWPSIGKVGGFHQLNGNGTGFLFHLLGHQNTNWSKSSFCWLKNRWSKKLRTYPTIWTRTSKVRVRCRYWKTPVQRGW